MSLLDDYENFDETSDESQMPGDPGLVRRKRAELERQITIVDSDLKKTLRDIADMEKQRKRFKRDEERIRIERDQLDISLNKLANDRRIFEEQITELKKKLKILQ